MTINQSISQTTPTVILGFASYRDGRFELIVRDDETREETTLEGQLKAGSASHSGPYPAYLRLREGEV